ncbi:hypothetical protein LIT32_26905 (plasmid) [Bacillus sp. CMF21]|nr:hypothetical protein LIT32_26905 [Bacillus sp. CMF21]
MYRNVSDELNLFSMELQQSLSPHVLKQLAKKVGFVKRSSKYQATFLVVQCAARFHAVYLERNRSLLDSFVREKRDSHFQPCRARSPDSTAYGGRHDEIVTATGDGSIAAQSAQHYVEELLEKLKS